MPLQTKERYLSGKAVSNIFIWNFNNQYKYVPERKVLRIQSQASATVKWSIDNWHSTHETFTLDSGVGIHFADIPTSDLPPESIINYTFYWHDAECWENKNYSLAIEKKLEPQPPPVIEVQSPGENKEGSASIPS